MAGMKEKAIIDRFGKPDHKSATGNMWYFKHMIYIRNRSSGQMSIKLLRLKKDRFEWHDEESNSWIGTSMQKIPMEKYLNFVNEQAEHILLGE